MSLPLATRGYLWPQLGVITEIGPGPTIIASDEMKPEVLGAGLIQADGPSISGAAIQAPQINTGAAAQSPAPGDAPVISGGQIQAPNIDGSEED